MFTPQKKLWSMSPRTDRKNGSGSGAGSGLVNGASGHETLPEKLARLENELIEYQYNMGLLLIEKKEWTSKHEELRQTLEEVTDTLKREDSAHSNAIYEVEKREESLKKALGVERQCVQDLEKALREMRSEYAEIKFNADSKLAEANALVTSVEEKSLEVEAKFHAADAKLAEVSRKSSEIERKVHDLEAQENVLRRERSFFNTEREKHDTAISKQKEDLREWEKKLQEAEARLADGRRLLNQREERANENDKILKEKQNDLEELKKKIEMSNSTLKVKEEDITSRVASLALKEKEADDIGRVLEEKERQLLELEEKLNTREKLEIQKLLDEHKSILAEKEKEFELEMEQKRILHGEQLKSKVVEVEKKEAEVKHMEEKVKKREQAIEKKSEKVAEKGIELDSKSKVLKEREKSLKLEEKNLEKERKQMLAEKEDLLSVKAEVENLKIDTERLQLKLSEEKALLKVTEEERMELDRLQSELKQEIDKYRLQAEQLLKEADDLKLEKEKFEKEWEELDDKRAEIKKEQDNVLEQSTYLEKIRQSEEERLQNEKLETQKYVQKELEALKLEKESFTATMEHEKSILAENSRSERSKLLHDFELQKQELEAEIRRKQEDIENRLNEKEKAFEQERDRELNNINYLREVAEREMKEMKLERVRIEKEKLEISQDKKHVETQQNEMKKDIEELVGLSQKLKDQRENFIKERERFIAFAEKQKNCDICGEMIREFMLSDLQSLAELENIEAPPLPKVAENYLKEAVKGTSETINHESSPVLVNLGSPTVGGTISWFKRCTTKILKFSPGKKLELDATVVDSSKTLPSGADEPEPSLQLANESFDVHRVESDSEIREVGSLNIPEDTQNSDLKTRRRATGKGGRARASKQRPVKASSKSVVEKSTEENENQHVNGTAEDSVYTNEGTGAESDLVGTPKKTKKRVRVHGSQATGSDIQTEGQSDSVKDGDRPKRRQRVVAAEQNVSQKRYNLRQPKKSQVKTMTNGSLPQVRKVKEKATGQPSGLEANPSENIENVGDGDDPPVSTGPASEFSADSPFKNAGNTHGEHADMANTSLDDMVMSEVNGTAEGTRDYSGEDFKTESEGDDDDNNDGDDDEVNHPGEASIGKKLWTFLTT